MGVHMGINELCLILCFIMCFQSLLSQGRHSRVSGFVNHLMLQKLPGFTIGHVDVNRFSHYNIEFPGLHQDLISLWMLWNRLLLHVGFFAEIFK